MIKKILILFIFSTLITGCNKNNQDNNLEVSSVSLHINKGTDVEQISLAEEDTNNFVDWLKARQIHKEIKNVKTLTSPLWCFVFNEGIKNKLMIYCYYPQLKGIALQRDYLIKDVDFYPVSEADKNFFKTNFRDLSKLNF